MSFLAAVLSATAAFAGPDFLIVGPPKLAACELRKDLRGNENSYAFRLKIQSDLRTLNKAKATLDARIELSLGQYVTQKKYTMKVEKINESGDQITFRFRGAAKLENESGGETAYQIEAGPVSVTKMPRPAAIANMNLKVTFKDGRSLDGFTGTCSYYQTSR